MRHPILITILSVVLVTFLVVIFDSGSSTSASHGAAVPTLTERSYTPTATEERWIGQNEKLAAREAKAIERSDRLEH